jgi:hypothetical protein
VKKTAQWERHNLNSTPNIIPVIKSKETKVVYVAGMGVRGVHTGFWWGNPSERDHLGPGRKRKNNIKVDRKEIGLEYVD